MKQAYEKLYNACKGLKNFNNCAHFVPMKGKYYSQNKNRLLLIGRATNGWTSFDDCSNAETFSCAAATQFESTNRFADWIEEIDGALYSSHDKYNEDGTEKKKKYRYRVSRSPFWSYSKDIWKALNPNIETGNIWMENIAWSNLYVVGPTSEGNPTNEYCDAQLSACKDILKREVELLNPTHILLLTGYNWFKDFEDCFTNVTKTNQRINDKQLSYTEATAIIGNARAVVMCRPEYRKKEQYVSEAFEELIL